MKIFVTGATGFVGSAVVKELLAAGHEVLGMARSSEGAKALEKLGAEAHYADLNDLKSMLKGAERADGLIHTAFNHDDFTVYKQSCENDRSIIEAFGDVFKGSKRPMVITSALGIFSGGQLVHEYDRPLNNFNPRTATEEAADIVASQGVPVSILRLPPSVHGEGDRGFIQMLIDIARHQGISVFQNEPVNYWPAVHRLDAAQLYRLALEHSASEGDCYHASAEQKVPLQEIATAIGKGLNVPVVGKTKEEAAAHFGSFAYFAAMDVQSSSEQTQRTLSWQPTGPGLIDDIQHVYFKG